jgi:hypothetical protein
MHKYIGLKKKNKYFYYIVAKDNESRRLDYIGFVSVHKVRDKTFAIDSHRLVIYLIKALN